MIIGKENIKEFLEFNKRNHFKIKRSENTPGVFEYNKENASVEEAKQALEKVFLLLEPGNYFIEAWKDADKKNWLKDSVQIGLFPGCTTGISGVVSGSRNYDQDDLENVKIIARNEVLRERELEEIKEELEELKGPYMSAIGKIEPYIPHLINALLYNKPMPVANISGIVDEQKDTLTERAQKALDLWYEIDKDAIIILEKIVNMARNDKKTYMTAKNMLMSQ